MESLIRRSITLLAATALVAACMLILHPATRAAYSQAHWVERSIPGAVTGISDVQVQAGNPECVSAVVSGSNNLYSSQDGGSTWGSMPSSSGTPFLALAESKSMPGEFFALDSNGDTYVSADGGGLWSPAGNFAAPGVDLDTGSDPDGLVATTGLATVQYTLDGAASWTPAASLLANSGAVAGDPSTVDVFYAAEQATLLAPAYKSGDGGASWAACGDFPAAVHVTSMAVFPYGGPVLAATDTPGVDCLYRSNDGGVGWTASATGLPADTRVFSLTVTHLSPHIAYAATDSGVFASYDCGTSWSDISGDLPDKDLVSVSASGGSDNTVFVGADDGTLYRTFSPFLTGIEPDSGVVGDLVTLTGVNLGSGGDSYVSFAGVDTTDCPSWSDTEVKVYVPQGASSGDVTVVTPDGRSNALAFTVTTVEPPTYDWYLAEGSTGSGDYGWFETWILVQNPGGQTAEVTITYMTGEGPVDGPVLVLYPNTRRSVNVADTVKDTWSVSTRIESDRPVIAERSMYWNTPTVYRQAAHDSIGVTSPAKTWYLAEGCTGEGEEGDFETWVLVQNPEGSAAEVNLTYMTPSGAVSGPTLQLEPYSRQSVDVAETVPNAWNVSTQVESDRPVIAERSVYWSAPAVYRQAAHDSIGVTAPSQTWYLAEGCTGEGDEGDFETWVLVQNPGQNAADVNLTYMTPGGAIPGPTVTLEPNTRKTVDVSEHCENAWNVSTHVESDRPVIAERSVYWSTPTVYRQAAHDSIGVTAPSRTWYLAEGCTGTGDEGNFETWVLVQNPGGRTAEVFITYMTEDGAVPGPVLHLEPYSRQSVNVAETVPNTWSVSTQVESDRAVIAERSVYWSTPAVYRQAAHDSIGVSQ